MTQAQEAITPLLSKFEVKVDVQAVQAPVNGAQVPQLAIGQATQVLFPVLN